MHHPTPQPTRWKAIPTAIVVVGAIGLGAVSARADTPAPAQHADPAPAHVASAPGD